MSESKKSKKAGRKLKACQNYRTNGRREINKAVRLIKVLNRNGNDTNAKTALKELSSTHVKAAQKKLLDAGYGGNLKIAG